MAEYEDVLQGLGIAPDMSQPEEPIPGAKNPNSASARYKDAPRPAGRPEPDVFGRDLSDVAMLGVPPAVRGVAAAAKAAPTLATILAALGISSAPTAAGEENFKWDDPDKARTARIGNFEQTMNNLNKEMRAASKARMPSVQKQMDQLLVQHNAMLAERQKERDAAFTTWQEQQAARMESERPFREQYPTAYRMLPLAGWGGSALGGLIGSKGGKPLASAIGGALGGIPGSAAAAVGPTAYDAATLPTGSKHQKQASEWLADPNYWLSRVAPEVLVGMGLGATAGKFGSYMPRGGKPPAGAPAATPPSASPLAAPPATAPAPAPAPAPAASRPPMNPNQGLVYDPKTRSWVRDPVDPANAEWFQFYNQVLQKSRENAGRVRGAAQ